MNVTTTKIFPSTKTLFLLFWLPFFAQTPKQNLEKLDFKQLTTLFFENEKKPKKQLDIANACLKIAKKEKQNILIARAYYLFSQLNKQDKAIAIAYLDSVIKYAKNTGDYYFPTYAYSEKGYRLHEQLKFKQAIDNYILAEKSVEGKTLAYYEMRMSIAVIKSEDLGEVKEALEIYKESFKFFNDKDVRDSYHFKSYQWVIFSLADAYKSLNQTDSTTFYNKLGFRESKITKNDEKFYLFILNEGANQVLKKNYTAALDSIAKALPKMIEFKDVTNITASYFYRGKAYEGLGNKSLAAQNYVKVDSIYQVNKRIFPELLDGYPFLIAYYKGKDDNSNQLKFMTRLMTIDSTLQKNYKELSKKLQKNYDIPHLLQNKQTLIDALRQNNNKSVWGIAILLVFLVLVGGYSLKQRRQKKQFQALLNTTTTQTQPPPPAPTPAEQKTTKTEISPEIVNQILNQLNNFETQQQFLERDITVGILAKQFATNDKYLSKIVNQYKNKKFTDYINDLRIDFAIESLKTNKQMRKYTVMSIANECGFNNSEAFATAFLKKTGLKATFFIKELDKL